VESKGTLVGFALFIAPTADPTNLPIQLNAFGVYENCAVNYINLKSGEYVQEIATTYSSSYGRFTQMSLKTTFGNVF